MKRSTKILSGTALVVILISAVVIRHVIGSDRKKDEATMSDPVAVEIMQAVTEVLDQSISSVGTVRALKDAVISSETAGRITEVRFKVGDVVRQGATLVVVDDELKAIAVDQAKAQALAAETNMKKAQKDLSRAEILFANRDISEAEIEAYRLGARAAEAQHSSAVVALRFAQRQLEDTRIKAPLSGQIASKRVEVGEMVAPGRDVANIVELSSALIGVSISEEDIACLRLGQHATVRLDAAPETVLDATVYSIGAKSENPMGHTFPVEVIVKNNSAGVLKAGMFARVEVKTNTAKNAVTVAKDAITMIDDSPVIFVADAGVAHARKVRLGIQTAEKVQIVEGVREGESVVTFGQKGLKDGARIRYMSSNLQTPQHDATLPTEKSK